MPVAHRVDEAGDLGDGLPAGAVEPASHDGLDPPPDPGEDDRAADVASATAGAEPRPSTSPAVKTTVANTTNSAAVRTV